MTFLVEEELFPTTQVAEDSVKEEVNDTDKVKETKHDAKRKLPETQAEKKVSLFLPFPSLALCCLSFLLLVKKLPILFDLAILLFYSIIISLLVFWYLDAFLSLLFPLK